MRLKVSSAKRRPFCLGLNELNQLYNYFITTAYLLSLSFSNLAQPSTMHFHFLHIQHIRQIKSNHCTKEFKLFCAMVWLYLSEWLDDKLFSYLSYLDYSSDQSGYGNRKLGTVFPLNEWSNSMMTSSNGNIFRVTGPLCGEFTGPGEFPTQRPVTRSFDVFFDLRLNKPLSKQSWGWWFETLSPSLWRHRNGLTYVTANDTYSSFDRCRVTSPDVARLNYQATNLTRNSLDVILRCQFSVMRNVHLICRKFNQLG